MISCTPPGEHEAFDSSRCTFQIQRRECQSQLSQLLLNGHAADFPRRDQLIRNEKNFSAGGNIGLIQHGDSTKSLRYMQGAWGLEDVDREYNKTRGYRVALHKMWVVFLEFGNSGHSFSNQFSNPSPPTL